MSIFCNAAVPKKISEPHLRKPQTVMAHSDFRTPANQICHLYTVTAKLDTPSWLSP